MSRKYYGALAIRILMSRPRLQTQVCPAKEDHSFSRHPILKKSDERKLNYST